MDRSDVLTLIGKTYRSDAFGIQKATETRRNVYCNVSSVTRTEWSEGGRLGLNPELRFTMFFYDYDNETIIEYNGERYSVYRTHRPRKDIIELYVTKDKGVQNGRNDST